jgi:hypothetical protein
MAEARLIVAPSCLGGADEGLFKDPGGGEPLGISVVLATDLTRLGSAGCLCGDLDGGAVCGLTNASSASLAATLWPISVDFSWGEVGLSKSNFAPCSWRIENWSRVGNLDESSSASSFFPAFESNAANGSPLVTLIGDGLGRGAGCDGGWLETAGGLPRLIGMTSGSFCSCCGGGENTAPTTGVVLPTCPETDCFSVFLGSDCERLEYISCGVS